MKEVPPPPKSFQPDLFDTVATRRIHGLGICEATSVLNVVSSELSTWSKEGTHMRANAMKGNDPKRTKSNRGLGGAQNFGREH